MKNTHGFSFVELVSIILLLSILSVVALPGLFDLDRFRGQGFYAQIVSATRYGQKLAVETGCDVQVSMDSASYSLSQRTSCDTSSPFTIAVSHPSGSGSFSGVPPNGIAVSSATIIFDAMGRALNTARVVTEFTGISVGGPTFGVIGETGYVYTP